MIFLAKTNPSWLSDAASNAMGTIVSLIRTALFWLTSIIYELIVNLYNIFDKLCNARILSNDILGEMADRVGVILGLIMFFYIVFSFIQMLIDPEKITNKESGAVSIIKKILLVIVMLGVSNFIFDALYGIQKKIIEEDVISKILLPYTVSEENKDKFGNILSLSLIKSFYYVDTSNNDNILEQTESKTYVNLFYNDIYLNNSYDTGYYYLNHEIEVVRNNPTGEGTYDDQVYLIHFNGLLSVVTGVYLVYILLIYCFKIGVRMIQLAFLEIISPMAIISYMSPKKDNMFGKWLKLYSATYIDVFIRIAIINFAIFLICAIFPSQSGYFGEVNTIWESLGELNWKEEGFLTVVIILALLTFAKKAPDLLKELLPAGASKLGFGASMKDIFGLGAVVGGIAGLGIGSLGRIPGVIGKTGSAIGMIKEANGWRGKTKAIGAAGAAFVGSALGVATGGLSGVFRGGSAGYGAKGGIFSAAKAGQQAMAKANLARANRINSGATIGNRIANKFQETLGYTSGYEILESEVSSLNELKSDLEKEDAVKYAQQAHDIAYNKYVEQQVANNKKAISIEDWEDTDSTGKMYAAELKNAKNETYKKLYEQKGAFTAKVDMHNKRFGTVYNEKTSWNDNINKVRKAKGTELEKRRAQKPKK